MGTEWLDDIKNQKNFYRDNYRLALNLLLFALIILLLLVAALFYVKVTQPPRAFYATSNEGGITKLHSLNTPNASDTPLIN
ncbi:MAG: DotI/IcmL/TraM family protein [Pseudomonadota bacterium]